MATSENSRSSSRSQLLGEQNSQGEALDRRGAIAGAVATPESNDIAVVISPTDPNEDVSRRENVASNGHDIPSIDGGAPRKDGAAAMDTDDATIPESNGVLDSIPVQNRVALRFSGLNTWVAGTSLPTSPLAMLKQKLSLGPGGAGVTEGDQSADAKLQILHDITGTVSPGEVVALMGPSGSGKTTLVSVLAGRKSKQMDVEGTILFNGKELTKKIKRRIGFVTQDDLMYESLTVEETLSYAAALRLPKTMTKAQKKQRVDNVIDTLGLSKCRPTLIGGVMMQGVSGGERKRVAVGHELLINPAFMVLDEPTSGLDSTTAMHLMKTIRTLAHGGRAILATIHQPSSRVYWQLDTLMLLSEGHIMYYGCAEMANDWFAHMKFPCTFGVNIADYILDLANGEVWDEGRKDDKTREKLVDGFTAFRKIYPQGLKSSSQLMAPLPEARGSATYVTSSTASQSSDSVRHPIINESTPDVTSDDRWGATFSEQCQILFSRAMKTRRFDSLAIQTYITLLALAVILGLLWWQRGGDNTLLSASDVVGVLFAEMIFLSYYSLFNSIFVFPNDFRMMLKERSSGMYRLSAYYVARSATDLPMECFIPSLFVIIVYWMSGLRASAEAFFAHLFSILLSVLVGQGQGMLIGAIFTNPKNGVTVGTVLLGAFMLSGGFFVREVPDWIDWVKYAGFPFWSLNLFLKIEFEGRDFEDCGGLGNEEKSGDCEPVEDLGDALSLQPDVNASVWPEIVVLVGMCLVQRAAIYYVLRKKTAS